MPKSSLRELEHTHLPLLRLLSRSGKVPRPGTGYSQCFSRPVAFRLPACASKLKRSSQVNKLPFQGQIDNKKTLCPPRTYFDRVEGEHANVFHDACARTYSKKKDNKRRLKENGVRVIPAIMCLRRGISFLRISHSIHSSSSSSLSISIFSSPLLFNRPASGVSGSRLSVPATGSAA